MTARWHALLAAAAVILSAATAGAEPLTARFIGNEGFELTDGKTVVLTDFPYDSGAFGYMTYGKDELRERKGSLCLITHAHADHFDAALAAKVGCRVLGPPSVLAKVPADRALSAGAGAPIRFGSAAITPVRTGHGDEPHFSYLLEWDGLRLYFTGDTDGAAELSRQGPLDALFISPWLLSESRKAGKLPKAARVFVYHHQATEKVADCSGACTVARQGEIYEIRGEGGAR